MFLSLAINHCFGFERFLLAIIQKKKFWHTCRSESFKAILGLYVSRSESIKTVLPHAINQNNFGLNVSLARDQSKQLWFEYFSLGIISQNKFCLNVSRSESHPCLGYIFVGFIVRLQWNLQRFCVFFFRHKAVRKTEP